METLRMNIEEYESLVRTQELYNNLCDYNREVSLENKRLSNEIKILRQVNDELMMRNSVLLSEIRERRVPKQSFEPKISQTISISIKPQKEDYVTVLRYV
jgi:hypothetical protein